MSSGSKRDLDFGSRVPQALKEPGFRHTLKEPGFRHTLKTLKRQRDQDLDTHCQAPKEPGFRVPSKGTRMWGRPQRNPDFWGNFTPKILIPPKYDPKNDPHPQNTPIFRKIAPLLQLWTYQADTNPVFSETFCTNLTGRVSRPHLHGFYGKSHSH